jgi:hypothetical protein
MPITLLTLHEAAERYQLPLEQLHHLVKTGTITPVTVNGDTLVDDEEVRRVAGKNGNDLHWVSLKDAAMRYHLNEELLGRLAKDGVIHSGILDEELYLFREDVEGVAARLDRANFRHLEGRPIELAQAAEQYGFPFHSLRSWVQQGHIRRMKSNRRRPTLLDESDVAYARALAELRGVTRGRALFPTSPQYSPVWLHG